jgi:DNA-binding response OmpR family regulator
MPGKMSGIDVAREARRRFVHLPIIFTSGFSNPEKIHSEAVTLGASLISKPYRKIDLAKQIRAALDRAKK